MKPEDFFNEWLETQPLLSVNPLYDGEWYLSSTQVFDFAEKYSKKVNELYQNKNKI